MRSPLDSRSELGVLFSFLHGSFQKVSRPRRVRDSSAEKPYGQSWETILPELLGEIIRRVGVAGCRWPECKNVLACAAVCKRWRDITKEVIRGFAPMSAGCITFLSSLKQPGPCDYLLHCLVERNPKDSTFYLYLAPSQFSKLTAKAKFLLAAKRYCRATHVEYIISCHPEEFSRGSDAYFGKLSSDVLGINFTIYDGKPGRSIGHVSYKVNLREGRGPRRFVCSLKGHCSKDQGAEKGTDGLNNAKANQSSSSGYTVLRNKAPLWNEYMKCFALNFRGRATMCSTRNFQVISGASDRTGPGGHQQGDEKILLQFGKVEKDTFTMDFGEPLSAFSAFAICLSSFGWKFPWQ